MIGTDILFDMADTQFAQRLAAADLADGALDVIASQIAIRVFGL